MPAAASHQYDVIIIGAGPVGLTVANFLGAEGMRVLILEQLERLIDYPRGVGIDDECLRVFQTLGLADAIVPHTLPNQWMEFQTARGRPLARIKPSTEIFGWPRRNAFIQPLTDKVLFEGLARYPSVEIRFGHEVVRFEQDDRGVTVHARASGGRDAAFTSAYLVGCDGGRSATRKQLGIEFVGQTESTQWLVVDIAHDPIGIPNSILLCDPARPYVSISLPHGVRRLEFMVKPSETEDAVSAPEGLRSLMARVMASPDTARIIRRRVYTHHARLAASFQSGRVFIAGDAAHLMPVWQGQGFNSGIRDANNLSWKLAAVLRGTCDARLLDTYTAERRAHAGAMISLSTLVGRIFSPTNRFVAKLRDIVFGILNRVPPVRDYVAEMRFKPMPRYTEGVVVPPHRANAKNSAVGRLIIQPTVGLRDGRVVKLDDAIGPRFAIVAWNADPSIYLDAEAARVWDRLGGRVFVVRSHTELGHEPIDLTPGSTLLGDASQRLRDWFAQQEIGVAILRPDRFVAAICAPQEISAAVIALARVMHLRDGSDAKGA